MPYVAKRITSQIRSFQGDWREICSYVQDRRQAYTPPCHTVTKSCVYCATTLFIRLIEASSSEYKTELGHCSRYT